MTGGVRKIVGGVQSPLLANIYLDALDKELESRGLSFCRYADDCNIYVGSRKAAERVFSSVAAWIERNLKIPVNRDKSGYGRPWERQFLGYQSREDGGLRPAPKSLKRFKDQVRQRFNGRTSQTSHELRDSWQRYIRGWCNYYALATGTSWRKNLSSWTRRHIRKCFWLRWHSAKGRKRNLLKLGVKPQDLHRCNLHGAPWPMSRHPAVHKALNNRTLKQYGFYLPSDFATT